MNVVAWPGQNINSSGSSNMSDNNNVGSSANIFRIFIDVVFGFISNIISTTLSARFAVNLAYCKRKRISNCLRCRQTSSLALIITGRLSELSLAKRSKTLWPTFDFIMSRFLRCQAPL